MSKKIKNKLRYFLKDVVDNRGKNPDQYFKNEKYPVIDNFLIENTLYPDLKKVRRYINQETKDSFLRKYLKKDDVLITLVGNGICSVCLSPSDNVVIIQNTIGLHTNPSLNNRFLYYYLLVQHKYLIKLDRGSSQPSVNQQDLLDFEIEIPESIEDQQKIASVLYSLDSKIELNRKINAELESIAKTLYDYWFVQFDFPDKNGKPYKANGGKMAWNEELKREIPEGWKAKKIKDLFEFEKGVEPGSAEYLDFKVSENCIRFFRVGDIEGESSVYIDSSNKKYVIVEEKDVIVTFDGSVGKLGYGLNGAISGGLRKIYDKLNKFDSSMIYFIFRDERIIATVHKYAIGSILLHASGSINHLIIPFDEKIYLKFQTISKPIFEQMVNNKQENQKLSELRNWLLPMLMNGQVKVK